MAERKNKITNKVDISSTGDIATNDFDLKADKKPAVSTISSQIKTAKSLTNADCIIAQCIEFDRLRIGLYTPLFGKLVDYRDLRMEEVPNPKIRPTSKEEKELEWTRVRQAAHKRFNTSKSNVDSEYNSDDFADELISDELYNDAEDEIEVSIPQGELTTFETDPSEDTDSSSYKDTSIKKRIRYKDIKGKVGLLNIFQCDGFLVIDITGKWMHSEGNLGSLHKFNIEDALQKILDLGVVYFDVKKFIKYAQIFCCDVCVDLELDSEVQVRKYISGIKSFFPISTNYFNIAEYNNHGLVLKPNAKSRGFSFICYHKGKELVSSMKRQTCATRYTAGIGKEGIERAKRTLRFELKLYKLDEMREWLEITDTTRGVIHLTNVLNSIAPVVLNVFKLFSGDREKLLERLIWLEKTATNPDSSLTDIIIAEWYIRLLIANKQDIRILRDHLKTEYFGYNEAELTKFNTLANIKKNILNFIVYEKPKSVTIMLTILGLLQDYYCQSNGDVR